MTLDDSAGMAEGKDPDESKGAAAGNEFATVNGHADDDDHAAGGSDFTASILGHPSNILIVTNVDDATFVSTEAKENFEALFRRYDASVQFQYLRSFRRARIIFQSLDAAAVAHQELYNYEFSGQLIKCYYAQPPIETRHPDHKYLEPPERDKQFLISPPASPPIGWEVIGEREPAINYDLINAIARMGPGESYELHEGTDTQPSIVVHICEDPVNYDKRPKKIVQTRCPSRKPPDNKPT